MNSSAPFKRRLRVNASALDSDSYYQERELNALLRPCRATLVLNVKRFLLMCVRAGVGSSQTQQQLNLKIIYDS